MSQVRAVTSLRMRKNIDAPCSSNWSTQSMKFIWIDIPLLSTTHEVHPGILLLRWLFHSPYFRTQEEWFYFLFTHYIPTHSCRDIVRLPTITYIPLGQKGTCLRYPSMVSATHPQQSITKGVGKTNFRLHYYLCTNVWPLKFWDTQGSNDLIYVRLYYKGKQDTALRMTP